ncbi:MAG TPA: septum formation initiator family protein [Nocardioides sp.]|nr:septum formation initiator family protein [Nocardioides sp.]
MPQPRRAPTGRPVHRPGGPRRVRGQGRPQGPRQRPAETGSPAAAVEPRSRFTGRAMVLVLVLSVLTISYASSLKAYFQQHSQIQDLRSRIAASQSDIDRLEAEKAKWGDPAYVREQARARFGYLMPGQTSYVVIGEDGKPLAPQASLSDPRTHTSSTPTAWWTTEWRSVELAGNPPDPTSEKKPLKYLGKKP